MTQILSVSDATDLSRKLFVDRGLAEHLAQSVAQALVKADAMGHRTHGLSLLPHYLAALENGVMAPDGEPVVLSDKGNILCYNGQRLPGAWLVQQTMDTMLDRVSDHGVVTATIANSFHIGALQVYLQRAAEAGIVCLMAATDPCIRSLAPHGGADAVTTTNPIACALPTESDPILIDLTTTVVSNATVRNHAARGEKLPGPWLKDGEGQFTDDPAAMDQDPPGTIAALGGEEFGYKGFALSMIVEALALALSGYGRVDDQELFTEGVFLQLIDPGHFAGEKYFRREMQDLLSRTLASRPAPGFAKVRAPGSRAIESMRLSETQGIRYSEDIARILKSDAA